MAAISISPHFDLKFRPYRSPDDFEAMKFILVEGRRMQTGRYYVHTGDLCWWLYYLDSQDDVWSHVYLWENVSSGIYGWTLLSPQFHTFDVFMLPELHIDAVARIYAWSASRSEEIACQAGQPAVRTMWISEADEVTLGILLSLGFERASHPYLVMERSLGLPLPEVPPLPGFRLRHIAGEVDLIPRAAVSHAAFGSRMPFDQYCQRYLEFMQSPVYNPSLDIVADDSQGFFTAFCIGWLDIDNRLGHFEPVGVHPDWRRRGLGKAVIVSGLERFQAYGMNRASVCVESENLAAISLYTSAGFEYVDRLFTFERRIYDAPGNIGKNHSD